MDAKLSAAQLMELENKHGAHNYHPVPVVLDKGEGVLDVYKRQGKETKSVEFGAKVNNIPVSYTHLIQTGMIESGSYAVIDQ